MRLDRPPYHNRLIRGPAKVGSWHETDMPVQLPHVRYQGMNGPRSDAVRGLKMTQLRHGPSLNDLCLKPTPDHFQCARLTRYDALF
jgi:hypothetical protein